MTIAMQGPEGQSVSPDVMPLWKKARPYQREDASFVAKYGRGILGHKTGLGKTLISLLAWKLMGEPQPVLIITGKSGLSVWPDEIGKWVWPEVSQDTVENATIYHGHGPRRDASWKAAKTLDKGIWLTNYHLFREDFLRHPHLITKQWGLVIMDEAHKARNRKTDTYKAVSRIKARHKIFLSATIAGRGPQDVWTVLNMLDPGLFGSYWKFVNTFCYTERNPWGGTEIIGTRNAEALRNMMRGRFYRTRTYEEVAPELPTVTRQPVLIDMDPVQRELYDRLKEEFILDLPDQLVMTPTVLANITRLRQMCVCPQLLDPSLPIGASFTALAEAIEDDPHTVVFTPFRAVMPILQAYLERSGYGPVFQLYGGMEPEDVKERSRQFKDARGIMLCTVDFAQSFALDTVRTGNFLGFSWDPNANEQAEGRLRRLDTKHRDPIFIRYFINRGSVEEDAREVVNGKVYTVSQFMQDSKGKKEV